MVNILLFFICVILEKIIRGGIGGAFHVFLCDVILKILCSSKFRQLCGRFLHILLDTHRLQVSRSIIRQGLSDVRTFWSIKRRKGGVYQAITGDTCPANGLVF